MEEQHVASHALKLALALSELARSQDLRHESDQIHAAIGLFQDGQGGLDNLPRLLESLADISRRIGQGPAAGGTFF